MTIDQLIAELQRLKEAEVLSGSTVLHLKESYYGLDEWYSLEPVLCLVFEEGKLVICN